jgi:3-deoxy-D-arabino-heptulosonate 7-phosphate (DAHP) synthase
MLEVHPQPEKSLSDAEQALSLEQLEALIPTLHRVVEAVQNAPSWNPS